MKSFQVSEIMSTRSKTFQKVCVRPRHLLRGWGHAVLILHVSFTPHADFKPEWDMGPLLLARSYPIWTFTTYIQSNP